MAVFADGKQPPVRPPKCRNPRHFPVDSLRVERHWLALQDLNRVDQGDPELDEPAPRDDFLPARGQQAEIRVGGCGHRNRTRPSKIL